MTKDGEYPLQFLLDVQRGEVNGAKVRDRVAAAGILLDRGFGRSNQLVEHEVRETTEEPSLGFSVPQLEALIQITDRMNPEQIQDMIDWDSGVVEGTYEELRSGRLRGQ